MPKEPDRQYHEMKAILISTLVVSFTLFNTGTSFARADARFAVPGITNVPPGKTLMPVQAAAPVSDGRVAERAQAAEAAHANLLAATSNTVAETRSPRRIKAVPGGGRAEFGLAKVFFPADANGSEPFTVTGPDGRKLSFQARFLAWHDTTTDQRWLLAQVTNRVGFILPAAGQVLYTNVFDAIRGSLRLRYNAHALEQDIILTESPPLPNGPLPENLRLEVWTEWFDSVPASRQTQMIKMRKGHDTLAADETLDFSSLRIGGGRAFSADAPTDTVPVAKTWTRVSGRDWLIETVDFPALKAKLDALGATSGKRTAKAETSREELIGVLASGTTRHGANTLAQLSSFNSQLPDQTGVVLDFSIIACVPVPPGIISWWPAGGNADDAIAASANHGSFQYTATTGPGQVGQGFIFGGDSTWDFVRVENAPSLNPTSGLTIEGWVYFDSGSMGWDMPIVSKDGQGADRQYLLTKTWDEVVRAHVGTTSGNFYYADGQIVLQPETWNHVAMTYSAADSTLAIYVNGELDVTMEVSGDLISTTEPLFIGGVDPYDYGFGYWWSGGIDEVDVFDRALSASEIQALYEAGAAGKINPYCVTSPADVAAWFAADGHPYDVSGNHTATLQNGATYVSAVASKGFSLDGVNDGVTVPDDDALDFGAGQDFSLEVWLKAEANSTTYGVMSVLGKRYTPTPWTALGYELFLVNGQPGLQMADASGFASFVASGDLRGGWHHLVATVDRDNTAGGHLYVDGTQVLGFNPTGKAGNLSNGDPLRIGVHPQSGFNGFYKGIIDEATVYRRALSCTEVSALYQAGSAGKCKADMDNDGMQDWWEMKYFGSLDQTGGGDADGDGLTNQAEYQAGTNPSIQDTDGDGLTDGEELAILVDTLNPSLGYLNPLVADTGGTGWRDDQKDSDQDGISNLLELRKYHSEPCNAHTFSTGLIDSYYFLTAQAEESAYPLPPPQVAKARAVQENLDGGKLRFTVSGAPPNARYDLYFVNDVLALNTPALRWKFRRVYSDIQCDANGAATFSLAMPDPVQGYFWLLSAEDFDGDGLSDGYEAWFFYNGTHTRFDVRDTDRDGLKDGWEVEYGLSPVDDAGNNGASGNPDNDGPNLSNRQEHDNYYAASVLYNASYDPLKSYNSTANRPVVTISPAPDGFVIKRNVGVGGSLANTLTVYYAVGGTALYGSANDYTLTPSPSELPRIYSVVIPATADLVTVTVNPTAAGLSRGHLAIVAALTPYSVAPASQVADPQLWAYAVDWNHNRATYSFGQKSLAEGFLINLSQDPATGYLQVKPTAETQPLPFVNLANSGRGTVARILVAANSNPGNPATWSSIVGEYYTSPNEGLPDAPGNPSRTTVDRYGNVWVGNRDIGDEAGGSLTKIGVVLGGTRCNSDGTPIANGGYLKPPFIYNTCVDRNRDGLIRTSLGLGDRIAWNDPALPAGDGDEAVIYYVHTTPANVRSVAVDRDNNVWAGSRDYPWQELIDGDTGVPVTGQKYAYGNGGYGAVVDPYGAVWSAGYHQQGLLWLPPGLTLGVMQQATGGILPDNNAVSPQTYAGYGVGIDPATADVWLGDYDAGALWQLKQSGCTLRHKFTPGGDPDASKQLKGIVVDGAGNVWVAHAGGSPNPTGEEVYRFRTSGEYVGSVVLRHPTATGVVGKSPHGVCVDAQARIWAICFEPATQDGKYYAMRIDPTQGVDPNTGNTVGTVVEAVELGQFPLYNGPYNYSDMTGFVDLCTTQPAGVWDFVEDSGADYTVWSALTLESELNAGTIVLEVRAADRIAELPAWPFKRLNATSGTIPLDIHGMKGRYLEVRANLLRSFGAAQGPRLKQLRLAWGAPGSSLQISSHPKSQTVYRGGAAQFSVAATGAGLSYQWFKDGSPVGTGSTLTVNNAQSVNAGRYWVRVADNAGMFLDSAVVRLHINSTPAPASLGVAVDDNAPTLGQPVNFSASMDISPTPGPVYYQWRRNRVPIAGASGLCSTIDNVNYTATYSITSVQCNDSGHYSVVFTNEYWKVASPDAELMKVTVLDVNGSPVPKVTVTPVSPITVTDVHAPPTLTATVGSCITAVCAQWYRTDGLGSQYGTKTLIPGATGLTYTLPNPVTCDALGYYMVEVFDEGKTVHSTMNSPTRVQGACQ